MTELKDHLKEMLSTSGLPGNEGPIRSIIEKAWSPFTDELSTSKLGNLYGLKKGRAKSPRKSVLIATHMDAIGLIVNSIENEFMFVAAVGGIDARVLPGQMVTVHGSEDIPGMVIVPPEHTLPESAKGNIVGVTNLLIDTGYSASEIAKKVQVGDLVSFANEPIEFEGGYVTGHSLDNRASVAVLTETLCLLDKRKHEWDLWAVATSQEELHIKGAGTAGYEINPSIAVVVDVNFAVGTGTPGYIKEKIGKGPTMDWGANTNPKMFKQFVELAEKLEIPFQKTIYERHSGTDAFALQVSREGIPTMMLSIPIRNMHTAVEMVNIKDIMRSARLLTEFISQLDDSFMDKINWGNSAGKDN
ncbi:MAG: M42 family peptidase [Chloroflexota bacterium]